MRWILILLCLLAIDLELLLVFNGTVLIGFSIFLLIVEVYLDICIRAENRRIISKIEANESAVR